MPSFTVTVCNAFDSLDALLQTALLLSRVTRLAGPRLGLVTLSGGQIGLLLRRLSRDQSRSSHLLTAYETPAQRNAPAVSHSRESARRMGHRQLRERLRRVPAGRGGGSWCRLRRCAGGGHGHLPIRRSATRPDDRGCRAVCSRSSRVSPWPCCQRWPATSTPPRSALASDGIPILGGMTRRPDGPR